MSAKEHFKGIEGKWKMESRTNYEVAIREKNPRTDRELKLFKGARTGPSIIVGVGMMLEFINDF